MQLTIVTKSAGTVGILLERQNLDHPSRGDARRPDSKPHGETPHPAAAVAAEERPGDRGVAGRVADATGAEVDDGAQSPVLGQQVARLRVAVEPHRPKRGRPGVAGVPGLPAGAVTR